LSFFCCLGSPGCGGELALEIPGRQGEKMQGGKKQGDAKRQGEVREAAS
jgi:hypothetical protein